MEIKPDKKLLTKQWLVLLTISVFLVFIAIALQFLIPLEEGVTSSQVAIILWPITIGIILLLWAISAPIITLWIKNLAYYIEDDRITIFKGILTKQQQNIPYRAITDFILRRSLYDRFLRIGSIRIQTAGQTRTVTGYEGLLSGLVHWEDLHQQLRSKLKILHPIAEATAVEESVSVLSSDDKLQQILEELKAIRKVLENK
ncbi:MAG: PH domain-containing protein [Bacteroidales bacterium]|nr:PH domain-containing protein [Bacteroidales bacterium]